jgi:SAM-dependent methyltransferase
LHFTGIFPKSINEPVPQGELNLLYCRNCHLGQLDRNFNQNLLYGETYGYRSGLNSSMVDHLKKVLLFLNSKELMTNRPIILDIASNDGTLLNEALKYGYRSVGIDPLINKFEEFYDSKILKINDFFNKESYFMNISEQCDIVTSLAVLYDLENPNKFIQDVYDVLKPGGLWLMEMSYTPWMLETGAYDTICHEHIEYYSFTTLKEMIEKHQLVVISVKKTKTNGGSMSLLVQKKPINLNIENSVNYLLNEENRKNVNTFEYWKKFSIKVIDHREKTKDFFNKAKQKKLKIAALGASTKGNVYLQYNQLTTEIIDVIGEVNPEKFGRYTPGSLIPIKPEKDVMNSEYDYLVVLPWHFKKTFEDLSKRYNLKGKLIYPFL